MISVNLPIAGFEGRYVVSRDGRIHSLKAGRDLRPFKAGRGYMMVTLCDGGAMERRYVHRIVAAAFVPPSLGGTDVNHIDGDKLNNRAENLEWTSPGENNRHARATGLNKSRPPIICGEARANCKITDDQLRDARRRRALGAQVIDLAAEFGVNKATMSIALRRESRAQ